ncbi:MAG: nucleotidyltransferase [Desulfatiglans sp.]|jgi:predicted nucleotidyltransferase|nr:nucleotidyltransferase [Desulfatiglans sp.]
MMGKSGIDLSYRKIREFCRRNHIRKLSVFGSFLRDDFNDDSDIDMLVEFFPDHIPGLIRLAGMENELSSVLGRKVDMRTAEDLSRYFRNDVLESAEVKYVEE